MKEIVKVLERRTLLSRKVMEIQENINDKQARAMIEEHFSLLDESVKVKKLMLARLRKALPERKVLMFFQIEAKIEAGFSYFLAEKIPLIK